MKRNPKYLRWLRTQPCCCCGKPGPSEAAHGPTAGMGLKGDDFDAVPLCAGCHRGGRYSMHGIGSWRKFAEFWDLDMDEKRQSLRERYGRTR